MAKSSGDQMTVAALVDEIRIARRMISEKNRHHALLSKCEAAVVHLSQQLHAVKQARLPWYRRALGPLGRRVKVSRAAGEARS